MNETKSISDLMALLMSLAIEEKLLFNGNDIFVEYYPHVNVINVSICHGRWEANCERTTIEHNILDGLRCSKFKTHEDFLNEIIKTNHEIKSEL